jgi:hypothetical protein
MIKLILTAVLLVGCNTTQKVDKKTAEEIIGNSRVKPIINANYKVDMMKQNVLTAGAAGVAAQIASPKSDAPLIEAFYKNVKNPNESLFQVLKKENSFIKKLNFVENSSKLEPTHTIEADFGTIIISEQMKFDGLKYVFTLRGVVKLTNIKTKKNEYEGVCKLSFFFDNSEQYSLEQLLEKDGILIGKTMDKYIGLCNSELEKDGMISD